MLVLFLKKNTLEICKVNHTCFFPPHNPEHIYLCSSTKQNSYFSYLLRILISSSWKCFSSLHQQKEPFDKLNIWVITVLCDLPTMLHTSYLIPIAQGQLNTLHLSLLWFNFEQSGSWVEGESAWISKSGCPACKLLLLLNAWKNTCHDVLNPIH